MAAETEVEAEVPSQVLAVTMAGLIAEAGSEQVRQECNWVNRNTIFGNAFFDVVAPIMFTVQLQYSRNIEVYMT